jgi:uncharacterized protein YndB with AHSA1/START domain
VTTPYATLHADGGRAILRFERRFSHPPEKVWKALTDPAEMAHWFPARVEMELKPGAQIRFTFEEGPDVESPDGEVVEVDPPRLFVYTWGDEVLRWELTPDGPGCRLVFTHDIGESGGGMLATGRNAAGWDECLEALAAQLDGRTPAKIDAKIDMVDRMTAYLERFGLLDGEVLDQPDGLAVRFEQDLVWRSPDDVWTLLIGDDDEPAVGASPPAGFTTTDAQAGAVTELDPPRLLEYAWSHDGEEAGRVRWEFSTDKLRGNRVRLTQTIPQRLARLQPATSAAWRSRLEELFRTLHSS